MDPARLGDAKSFEGFRYEKIRQSTDDLAARGRTQWATSNFENMAFGYGRHACPGRFFASNEIKIVMIHFLMSYDFKFIGDLDERPKNIPTEIQLIPDQGTKLSVLRRE